MACPCRALWAPHRPELDGCECATCHASGPAARTILLGMVRAGVHQHMSLAQRAAEAREIRADLLAHLRATGAPESYIAVVERGYAKGGSLMADGIGAGMTPSPRPARRPRPVTHLPAATTTTRRPVCALPHGHAGPPEPKPKPEPTVPTFRGRPVETVHPSEVL